MTIFFASDHAGFELKNILRDYVLEELGFAVEDCGATELNTDDDYTIYIAKAARTISLDPENNRAIILGGSGQGEAMLANRFPNVRAVVYYGSVPRIVALSREHNDSNVLSIGARFVTVGEAKDVVKEWMGTEFTKADRHIRRIAAIEEEAKKLQ